MGVQLQTFRRVDSFWLKIIALVTMTVDHVAAAGLVPNGAYLAMRIIGRIAFPIYAFLLAEGFYYTHSRAKYMGRLLLVFVIAEPIYDWTLNYQLLYWDDQNIMLELAIGLGTIWAIEALRDRLQNWYDTRRAEGGIVSLLAGLAGMAAVLVPATAGMALSELLMADYGWGGILLILLCYAFRTRPGLLTLGCLAGLGAIASYSSIIELFGLLAMIPLSLYNGRRGKILDHRMQLAFYAYYPLHLLVIFCFVCAMWGLPPVTG